MQPCRRIPRWASAALRCQQRSTAWRPSITNESVQFERSGLITSFCQRFNGTLAPRQQSAPASDYRAFHNDEPDSDAASTASQTWSHDAFQGDGQASII